MYLVSAIAQEEAPSQTSHINFGFKNMRMVGAVNQRLLYARKIRQLEMQWLYANKEQKGKAPVRNTDLATASYSPSLPSLGAGGRGAISLFHLNVTLPLPQTTDPDIQANSVLVEEV